MKRLLFILLFICVAGCATSKPNFVFDGSTAESTKAGIATVMKRLDRAEKIKFGTALVTIQFSDINTVYEVANNPTMQQFNYALIGRKIDGLTYDQVLELAKQSPNQFKDSD
ncbi:DUF6694 family lipoprotein [Gilvimarinus xylanilyticus]|uniref:Uncharacterized protein n=1 Tax=Gilvimarinus xylanilyticus TaxID=2944139 RepID=A0A9X2KT95_9GAMM|nr:DUF6694 family lipoprotein [Gilvimarinus xylanilyticus]MCP8899681.1 hypothetical protein [Gilvimarinus xylanilyticus]